MPGWSPEIANEFIILAAADGRAFNQSQLQKLVYIAHGWRLAYFDEPLTGDRPEAWSFGPVYRRLADALAFYGQDSVTREIMHEELYRDWTNQTPPTPARTDLNASEMDSIKIVYDDYGALDAAHLSVLTQQSGTPWARIFAGGAGEFQDIPHHLIRAQFVDLAKASEEPCQSS